MKRFLDGTQVADGSFYFSLFDGRIFSASTDLIIVSGTGESDFLLIKNPLGSGRLLVGHYVAFGADTATARTVFRSYVAPTITANGTAITPRNNRISSNPPASVMETYRSPTISARGTFNSLFVRGSGTDTVRYDRLFIVEPGISVLGTVQNSVGNTSTHIDIFWREVDL